MRMSKCKLWIGLSICCLAMTPKTVRADGSPLELNNVTGTAGEELTVSGTITNTATSVVYLNGENFNLASSNFINGDVTDFFNNAPLFLDPGNSSGLISLFSFEIAPGTAAGIYSGNSLQILGGPGNTDLLDIADANFTVSVVAAPEPTTLAMMMVATSMVLTLMCFRGLARRVLN
jgi:hypothetical protein